MLQKSVNPKTVMLVKQLFSVEAASLKGRPGQQSCWKLSLATSLASSLAKSLA